MKQRNLLVVAIGVLSAGIARGEDRTERGSVIFIHPDGASAATWAAARALYEGPDGNLNWDRLPAIALYRGHMADRLTATSNGGGTTHAYGIRVASDAFGRSAGGDRGRDIVDGKGQSLSVARQAMRAGLPVGLVQTGANTEPGTACFVASVPFRTQHEEIAAQLVASGTQVILGGGERYFLPEGTRGTHGPGQRTDGRNVVDEAKRAGYAVVYTRRELLALSADTERVLGLFAANHTFHAKPEEQLRAAGLPLYEPSAPTVAEMTDVALRLLSRDAHRFLLVIEEEGTDNFGNHNNARGVMEAMRRADEAIGVAQSFLRTHPATLILTAADSDAGGMRMVGLSPGVDDDASKKLPEHTSNGAPLDGRHGTGTEPFLAAPDRTGRRLPFGVVWASSLDVTGGVLVRADGLNSHHVRGSFDNTEIAKLIRLTLLGTRE